MLNDLLYIFEIKFLTIQSSISRFLLSKFVRRPSCNYSESFWTYFACWANQWS